MPTPVTYFDVVLDVHPILPSLRLNFKVLAGEIKPSSAHAGPCIVPNLSSSGDLFTPHDRHQTDHERPRIDPKRRLGHAGRSILLNSQPGKGASYPSLSELAGQVELDLARARPPLRRRSLIRAPAESHST